MAAGVALTNTEAEEELELLLADPRLELPKRGRACLRYLAEAKFRGDARADPNAMATELFGPGRELIPSRTPLSGSRSRD